MEFQQKKIMSVSNLIYFTLAFCPPTSIPNKNKTLDEAFQIFVTVKDQSSKVFKN